MAIQTHIYFKTELVIQALHPVVQCGTVGSSAMCLVILYKYNVKQHGKILLRLADLSLTGAVAEQHQVR